MSYSSTDTSFSHNNEMEGEVMDSRPTKCMSMSLTNKKHSFSINFGIIYVLSQQNVNSSILYYFLFCQYFPLYFSFSFQEGNIAYLIIKSPKKKPKIQPYSSRLAPCSTFTFGTQLQIYNNDMILQLQQFRHFAIISRNCSPIEVIVIQLTAKQRK